MIRLHDWEPGTAIGVAFVAVLAAVVVACVADEHAGTRTPVVGVVSGRQFIPAHDAGYFQYTYDAKGNITGQYWVSNWVPDRWFVRAAYSDLTCTRQTGPNFADLLEGDKVPVTLVETRWLHRRVLWCE